MLREKLKNVEKEFPDPVLCNTLLLLYCTLRSLAPDPLRLDLLGVAVVVELVVVTGNIYIENADALT